MKVSHQNLAFYFSYFKDGEYTDLHGFPDQVVCVCLRARPHAYGPPRKPILMARKQNYKLRLEFGFLRTKQDLLKGLSLNCQASSLGFIPWFRWFLCSRKRRYVLLVG